MSISKIQFMVSLNMARMRLVKSTLLFYWDTIGADGIIIDWKVCRPIGPSLNSIVVTGWLMERRGITLKFKRTSNAIWRYFENDTLDNATNRPGQKHCFSEKIIDMNALSYFGRFMSAEYGYKLLTRLSIKEGLQKSANEWFENHIKGKGDWVAVHYRGTDVWAERSARGLNRRCRLELRSYVTYLKEVLGTQCTIFACSDQAQFINEMKVAFPERVFARNIKRSYSNKAIHFESHRPTHRDNKIFEQEVDALIDILVLAKARLIYTTGSAFVDVVRYFNPEIKIVSLDGRTIGRGKNNMPIPEPDLFKRLSLP